jgi:hypothetical protein
MQHDPARLADTRAWLDRAATDIRAAQHGMKAEPPLVADVLFHCQQAVEKCFKAFLAWHDVAFRKTHSLVPHRILQCIEHFRGIEVVVFVHDPIPQSRASCDARCEFPVEHMSLCEPGEGGVIVRRRGMARFREQVVVDVNHPADDPLEVSLGEDLLDAAFQIGTSTLGGNRTKSVQVAHDEQDFARDELWIDHRAARRSLLAT